MIKIINSIEEHAQYLGPRLRSADTKEAMIIGMTGEQAITESMKHSFVRRTAMLGDEPVAMWGAGYVSPLTSSGFLWAMTGCRVPSLAKYLLPVSRDFVSEMQDLFTRLEATVDPDYKAARRWLGWLGFHEAGQCIFNGATFITVRREG